MAPSTEELNRIAHQAEADLNTYQAKTGEARNQADDVAGVRSNVENKFPGADVRYGDDLSTNGSWNKRIPPTEGGDLDDRGRQARGEHYDHKIGSGGPQDKIRAEFNKNPGQDEGDVVPANIDPMGRQGEKNDALLQGQDASVSNVGRNPPGPGGNAFKGENYYTPESVPDSISAEGYVAPESVTQASREAEVGGFRG